MSEITHAWEVVPLGKVATTQLGRMLSARRETGAHAKPYLRNRDVQWGRINTDDLPVMDFNPKDSERFLLRPGDILVCEGGEVGRAAMWNGQLSECYYQKAIHRVRPSSDLLPQFLAYLMEHYSRTRAFERYTSGSTIAHLPQEDLRNLPVPLPSTREQQKIVAAIEEQFSRLGAGIRSLDGARHWAARMRSSVLDSSINARWAEQSFGIAEGWPLETVGSIAESIVDGPFGSKLKTEHYQSQGVRVIRLQNIADGRFDDTDKAYISTDHADTIKRHEARPNDVVIAALGDILPRACVIPLEIGRAIVKADCFRLRPRAGMDPKYVTYALSAPQTRKHASTQIAGVGRPRLNLRKVSALKIPVPTTAEQEKIVASIDEQFSSISAMEETIVRSTRRADQLRTSILAAAFSGRLA
jgi:type I restriction enzyme S subunit